MQRKGDCVMTRKTVWIITGGLLFNAVTGFVILRNSMHDKDSLVFSCIAYLLWIAICVGLTCDRKFSLRKAYSVGLVLALCYAIGVLFSYSFFGIIFLWPFMGIAYQLYPTFDYSITVLVLYFLIGVIMFVPALRREWRLMKTRSSN
jgi:hypothetical protein